MTREELKKKLIEMGNGYVITWGASAISKDLLALLQEGEEILEICAARKSSLFKVFKGGRAVSCYLAITNKRFIYIERGRRDMSLNPLCRKTITVSRNGMKGNLWANKKAEKMLYPYILQIQSGEESCEIAVAKDISRFLQGESSITENQINNAVELNVNTAGKKKKSFPKIIGGIIGAVLLIFVMLLVIGVVIGDEDTGEDRGRRESREVSKEVVELNTYDGGFAGWKADGYPGSVRTDITIPYPLENTEYNSYAVFIGTGKMNAGVIMQENEAPMTEWEWLVNAEPDYDTEAYYFSCTLTYTGQDVGKNELPLFVIDDVESYFGAEIGEMDDEDVGDEDIRDEDIRNEDNYDIDYESVYTEVVNSIYANGINNYTDYFMEIALYDVDMDGIMELLIDHGTGEADRVYEIYSTNGKQVVKIGEIGSGYSSLYEGADGNLYLDYCQMGYEVITYISIKNGEIIEETMYEGDVEGYVYSDEVLQTPIEMYSVE